MMTNVSNDTESIKSMIVSIIDQNKGLDIVTFAVQNRTIIAKYMIITSGDSSRHVRALAEHVIKSLERHDKIDVEGMDEGNWVILNFQGIMVHIFRPEVRELIAWAIQVQLYKYRTFRIAPQEKVSSQCLTLGSRKLNYKRAHYTTFLMKLHEKLDSSVTRWNDIIIDIFHDNVHIQNNILKRL